MTLVRPTLALIVASGALFALPDSARAQSREPTPDAKLVVTPPKLQHDPGVAYPKAQLAKGEYPTLTVDLVLEIGADGTVKSATVDHAAIPLFDEAAIAAARRLRFSPAQRGDTPIAVKVRFRYLFQPPPPVLSGRVSDETSNQPVPDATLRVTPESGPEIILRTDAQGAFRSEALPRGKAKVVIEAPGFLTQAADVELTPQQEVQIRARLERPSTKVAAPAATRNPEQPVEVVVRGERLAPAVSSLTRGEVREMPGALGDPFRAIEALPGVTPIISGLPFFYVRGAPPGNVGYFLDGIRVPFLYHLAIGPSVIHPGLVDRVDLYPGGYPARLGRFAGGIVAAETTAPRVDLHGEAQIRPFDAGAMVETGFADGRGTVLLGGRYSYTAALFSLLVPDLKLDYRDYQARITYDVTNRDRVSLFGFGSYDLLAQKQPGGLNVLFGSEFYRLDLRHEHRFDHGSLTTAVTLGYDQTKVGDEGNAIDRSIALRTTYRHELGRRSLLRAGADVQLDGYASTRPRYVDPDDPEVERFQLNNPGRKDLATGVWGDLVLAVAPGIEITPGLRLDLFNSVGATRVAVDPRIAARFKVSPRVTIVHAYGIAHQPAAFVLPVPGRTPAGLKGGLQQSFQTSSGVEIDLGQDTKLTSSVFYNSFFNMSDTLATSVGNGPPDDPAEQRSLGSAVGFELFLHRRLTQRLGGFLSYTLSRSMRSIGNERFPNTFDRTHVINAALGYNLGRNWRAGTRVVFYTGVPKVPEANGTIPAPRSEHPERTNPFFRVDFRLEKKWYFRQRGWISFVAEMLNASLSKEQIGDSEVGPIAIPSIGVEAGF